MLGILFGFSSLWGWNSVWFAALQDLTPVSHDVCCPLFFFLWFFGWFRRRRFSLFSFSQALGKPKPHFGFGVPLVFLRHGRALRPRSVRLHFLLHQGFHPALCVCFFFVGARIGVFLVFCRSTWLSVLVFFWVVFWVLVLVVPFCFVCKMSLMHC